MAQIQLDELLEQAKNAYERNDNDTAETLGLEALQLATSLSNVLSQGHAHNTIGISCLNRGLQQRALEHFIEAQKLLGNSTNPKEAFPSLLNIAIIYNSQGQFADALKAYKSLLQLLHDEPPGMQHAQLYTGMGNVHTESKNYEEALPNFQKALEICTAANIAYGIVLSLRNMASVLTSMKKPHDALPLAEQSKNLAKEQGFTQLYLGNIHSIADCYLQLGHHTEALEILLEHLPQVEALKQLEDLDTFLNLLVQAYELNGDISGAYNTQKRWITVNAEWQGLERSKAIANLQLSFETEKKEKQIQALELNKRKLEQEYTQAELASLKSRMNPHFIFNVMNSIQSLVYTGDKYRAVEAIGLFADVMRGTLHHSGKQWVSLKEEMGLLQQYIQLESFQFAEGLTVDIDIADTLDLEQLQIPGMLLQPLVENAIKHGLSHLEGEKRLRITIAENDDKVSIAIDDNGIGRNRSAEINQNRTGHQSFATGSIEKRLALINNQGPNHVTLQITDKFEQGAAAGTLVILTLNHNYE